MVLMNIYSFYLQALQAGWLNSKKKGEAYLLVTQRIYDTEIGDSKFFFEKEGNNEWK